MKILTTLALPLFLAASTLAQAAVPAGEHHHDHGEAGHDHSEHAATPPADESAVDYMWRKSDEAFHDGDYERAIGLHKAIIAIAPDEVESYGNAAWLIWSGGRGDEAIALIERGLKANPDNWEMWVEAGQHYGLQKKTDKERDAYARAVQVAPKGTELQMVRRALAHAAEKSGELALSVATWRQLVQDYPADVVNKNNLARVEKLLEEQKNNPTPQAALPHSGSQTALALAGLSLAVCVPALIGHKKI